MKLPRGMNAECDISADPSWEPHLPPHPRAVPTPARGAQPQAHAGLRGATGPTPPRTSGRMNCSTGLYHSWFTCTPQLGGLKRAMKRASYKWGGGKKKYFTLDAAYAASFHTADVLVN